MKFGVILERLKNGKCRASRKAWTGKNLFIYMEKMRVIPAAKVREPQKTWLGNGKELKTGAHLNLFSNGVITVGFNVPTADQMVDDWELWVNCSTCKTPLILSDRACSIDFICPKCQKVAEKKKK